MTVIPAGYAEFAMDFGGAGLPLGATITFGVQNATAKGAAAALTDIIVAIDDAGMVQRLSSSVSSTRARLKLGPNSTGAAAEANAIISGAAGATMAPPNVCLLVEKNTNLGGRQGKGRMFLPGVPEGDVGNGGALGNEILTAFQTILGELAANLIAEDLPPVLLHGNALAPTPVVNFSLDPTAATQRRRLRR